MAYKFLVFAPLDGGAVKLCEGGVYCDDSAILASASDYRGNNFAEGAAEADRLNSNAREGETRHGWRNCGAYELRDTIDGVDATDSDVLSSLVAWQLSAILDGAAELGTLSNASAVYRERGRRVVDSAVAPCFVLLDVTGTAEEYAGDARAALSLANENSTIWHKPGGNERPYQLDAIRLNALADMESGRALMGNPGGDFGRLAEAIAAAFGRDMPDTLARELGRVLRFDGLSDRYAELAGRAERMEAREADLSASVAEWKAEAKNQDNARAAAIRECEGLRRAKVTAESNAEAYRQQRDAQSARAVKAEQLAESRLADATAFRIKHMDAEKAVSACSHLMAELGGLTLGMLPRGAYGGALASAYADAKAAIADMDKGA